MQLARPRGPGGPARPAPAAELKGGRGLSSPVPIEPPEGSRWGEGLGGATLTLGSWVTKKRRWRRSRRGLRTHPCL